MDDDVKLMDYRELLIKYIQHIRGCESVDYVLSGSSRGESDIQFSDQEWQELERLAQLIDMSISVNHQAWLNKQKSN